jgi:hypothetical protein
MQLAASMERTIGVRAKAPHLRIPDVFDVNHHHIRLSTKYASEELPDLLAGGDMNVLRSARG